MNSEFLRLRWAPAGEADCACLLIIPERSIEEPGYIKAIHPSGAGNKHEFQALAQTGYYQYQDDELDFSSTVGTIEVIHGTEKESIEDQTEVNNAHANRST